MFKQCLVWGEITSFGVRGPSATESQYALTAVFTLGAEALDPEVFAQLLVRRRAAMTR